MRIKGVTKKGEAIKLSPKDALMAAVQLAAKAHNTKEVIYWIERNRFAVDKFNSLSKPEGEWEAWIEGRAMVGKTTLKDGRFFVAREHKFKIHYKTGKDEFGIPDIILGTKPELHPAEKDPSKMVGNVPIARPPKTVVGELQVQPVTKRNSRKK